MHRKAYVLLLLTALFWGGNAVAGKLAIGEISPLLLTALRWAMALVVLLAFGWRRLVADWPVVRNNIGLLLLLATIGFTAFNVAMYSALNYTSAINASIEQAGVPMVIFVVNFVFFRMRVSLAQILGFVLSVVGVAVTAIHGDFARLAALDVNFGDALMLFAVVVYGIYTVILRFKPELHWQSLMIVLSAAAVATSIPFALWEILSGNAILPGWEGWAITAYTALFPSILAQIFYIAGVDLIGANRAGIFVNMVPIFGTLLSVLVLGESFQIYHAAAMVLVLGGIWIAEHSGRKMVR